MMRAPRGGRRVAGARLRPRGPVSGTTAPLSSPFLSSVPDHPSERKIDGPRADGLWRRWRVRAVRAPAAEKDLGSDDVGPIHLLPVLVVARGFETPLHV